MLTECYAFTFVKDRGFIMLNRISYTKARRLVLDAVHQMSSGSCPVEESFGRILAQELTASENVPPFDRSPYDGYAFRAADTVHASKEHPVTLRILEEIPAGGISHFRVTEGTAVKILTGAPIPEGADAVRMFEKTVFTKETVTLSAPARTGENIVCAGEDVKKGSVLAQPGMRIDAGLCGVIAAQNLAYPLVYERPLAGFISTGSELLEVGEEPRPGKIFDSNRFALMSEMQRLGCRTAFLGVAKDNTEEIAERMENGLAQCDFLVVTGGVSVGDYDLTEKAMESVGAEILVRGIEIKPGMACAYGVKDGKLIAALSGNPASSLINFHVVTAPAIRKMCGLSEDKWIPETFPVVMERAFMKSSPLDRFLRGKLYLCDGTARMRLSQDQGNVVLSSSIGADIMAVIPAGHGPVAAGEKLEAFLL